MRDKIFSLLKKILSSLSSIGIWDDYIPEKNNEEKIKVLFDLTRGDTVSLDDETWADLNVFSLMRSMDSCHTGIGRQYLYRILRDQSGSYDCFGGRSVYVFPGSEKDDALSSMFSPLTRINTSDSARILYGDFTPKFHGILLSLFWFLFSISSIVAALFFGGAFYLAAIVCVFLMSFIHFILKVGAVFVSLTCNV